MSTSPIEGFVAYFTGHYDETEPVDSLTSLVVANNALHLADEGAQTRVAWVAKSGLFVAGDTPTAIDTYYLIAVYGPFPTNIRHDGRPYPLVVRLRGLSGNAHEVTFAVVRGPLDGADALAYSAEAGMVATFTSTSATSAWLGTATINPTLSQVDGFAGLTRSRWSPDPSGLEHGIESLEEYVTVWGKTVNVASSPRLTGLVVRECISTT